jgi:hypothetical protein
MDVPVLTGRLRHALHRPGGEREVLSLVLVAAERGASLGHIDLEEDRDVVLLPGQAEHVEAGRA